MTDEQLDRRLLQLLVRSSEGLSRLLEELRSRGQEAQAEEVRRALEGNREARRGLLARMEPQA